MKIAKLVAISGPLFLLGCTGGTDSFNRAETQNQAIEAANAYLGSNWVGANEATIEAIDMGNRWRLKYESPERGTGGPIIVVVNKRSGEVVHAETQQ